MEAQFSFVRPHAQPKVAVWRPPLLIGWKLKSCGNALFSGPSIRQWKWLCLLLPLVLLLDHTSKSRQQQQQQQQQWVPLENQNGRNHSKLVYFLWKLIKFNVIGWTHEKKEMFAISTHVDDNVKGLMSWNLSITWPTRLQWEGHVQTTMAAKRWGSI